MSTHKPILPFTERAPVLELQDPLAEILGALPTGATFRYTYDDVVKLSGHSCPTVAGAYLMIAAALEILYGSKVPVRGDIQVTIGGARDEGVWGPISQVITLVTGAAPETGFCGLMGAYKRKGLLSFDPSLQGRVRFRRIDTGDAVDITYDPDPVTAAPELGPLLGASLSGRATSEQRRALGELWQARVADLLTGDASRVLSVQRVD